jgi:hypothetical protein
VLTGATTPDVPNTTTGLGRVQRVTSAHGRTILTVDGPDGVRDLVLPISPDRAAGVAAAAGLWRLQWVRLHIDAPSPIARLAGTTRHPHVRSIPLSAALALAEQGVPAFVVGEGD